MTSSRILTKRERLRGDQVMTPTLHVWTKTAGSYCKNCGIYLSEEDEYGMCVPEPALIRVQPKEDDDIPSPSEV